MKYYQDGLSIAIVFDENCFCEITENKNDITIMFRNNNLHVDRITTVFFEIPELQFIALLNSKVERSTSRINLLKSMLPES